MERRTATSFPDHDEGKVPGLDEAFAVVLRRLRRQRGLSQQEIANRSGLGRVFISLLERGQRRPSLSTLFQVAWALEVEPSELFSQLDTELQGTARRTTPPPPTKSR